MKNISNESLTENELNLMLHRITQDINIGFGTFLKNNGDAIFSAASTNGRTSIVEGYETSLSFLSGDSLEIPMRINLNCNGEGLASMRVGMSKMNTSNDFVFKN